MGGIDPEKLYRATSRWLNTVSYVADCYHSLGLACVAGIERGRGLGEREKGRGLGREGKRRLLITPFVHFCGRWRPQIPD